MSLSLEIFKMHACYYSEHFCKYMHKRQCFLDNVLNFYFILVLENIIIEKNLWFTMKSEQQCSHRNDMKGKPMFGNKLFLITFNF